MEIKLTQKEIEIILNKLPRAWTEEGVRLEMVELKYKLMLALNRSREDA